MLHRRLIRPVAPILAWWTDDTSNVTTRPKHKAHGTAGKLRDAPGRLPGNDMILLGTNGVDVLADLPKVNGHTLQDNLIGLDQVAIQVATFHHLPLDIGYLWLVNEHRRIAYLTEILQRDQEGRRINRVVPDGRKKRQGH